MSTNVAFVSAVTRGPLRVEVRHLRRELRRRRQRAVVAVPEAVAGGGAVRNVNSFLLPPTTASTVPMPVSALPAFDHVPTWLEVRGFGVNPEAGLIGVVEARSCRARCAMTSSPYTSSC